MKYELIEQYGGHYIRDVYPMDVQEALRQNGIEITEELFERFEVPSFRISTTKVFARRYFGKDGKEYAYLLTGSTNLVVFPNGRVWSQKFKNNLTNINHE